MGFYKDIQDRIDTLFHDILLRGDTLFQKDEIFLQKEQEKIAKIRSLYHSLSEEYKNSEKILYLLESIDYKLSLYESIIKNTQSEKNLQNKLSNEEKKMKGVYYTRV